jgi:2-polyprenyl-3-methyl-5-hydroxy-6-metoxy-1,4-benzoquinol methylase
MSRSIEVHQYLGTEPALNVDRYLGSRTANYVLPRLKGKRALELGVGHGAWTAALLTRFSHVTTIERAPELLDALQGTVDADRWTPVCCSFEDFEPTDPFDTVVATYVLEHVSDPLDLLERVRRWLGGKGRVAITVPNALSLHRRLAAQMGLVKDPAELGETDRKMGHFHCFTPERIEATIQRAGFRILERAGLLAKPLPNPLLANCSEQQLEGLFEVGKQLPMEFAAVLYYLAEPLDLAQA